MEHIEMQVFFSNWTFINQENDKTVSKEAKS